MGWKQPSGKAEDMLYIDIICPSQGDSLCPQWVPGVASLTRHSSNAESEETFTISWALNVKRSCFSSSWFPLRRQTRHEDVSSLMSEGCWCVCVTSLTGRPTTRRFAQPRRGSPPGSPVPAAAGVRSLRRVSIWVAAPHSCTCSLRHTHVYFCLDWAVWEPFPGRDPAGRTLRSAEFRKHRPCSQEALPKSAELSQNVASLASPASHWGTAHSPFLWTILLSCKHQQH